MPPAQPTLVLTTLQMVLLSDAELNQECLAKDFLNCGQYKMAVFFYYSLFLQDIFKLCSDESSGSILIYHAIKLKGLNI